MFYSNEAEMHIYAECMEAMKRLNREYYDLRKSRSYKIGMFFTTTIEKIKKREFLELKKIYHRWILGKKHSKLINTSEREFPLNKLEPYMYFSEERIAVYTVIFGKYDKILEPQISPNNIDYFIITDQNVDLSNSIWKKIDISEFNVQLEGLTNAEKNRFFKMMPQRFLENYKYSIYIDGNIQIVTDVTEYINLIGRYDIATHQHFCRDCVYDECVAVLSAKKDKPENIEKHRKLFLDTGMPFGYGLMECNVLARRHTEQCKKIMEMWWNEYQEYSSRDQLSLPHVLFLFGIPVKEITVLGPNVFKNPTIRVTTHK